MTTKHKLTDEEWLAKFEAGEIEFDPSQGHDLRDLAEVRAYELLRRECDDALTNAVRLARQRGVRWVDIAIELGLGEAEATSRYRPLIGDAAEAAGDAHPEVPAEPTLIGFYVRFLDEAARQLDDAVVKAKAAGVDDDFIANFRDRPDDDARLRWNVLH